MEVSQLIALLQQMPQDAEVITEGCDCTGDTHAVMLDDGGQVTILREEGAIRGHERMGAKLFLRP
jgi:hypothetical protein